MIELHQMVLFSSGVLVGLALIPVLSRIFDPESVQRFFERLGRGALVPFLLPGRLWRREPSEEQPGTAAPGERPDLREHRINGSLQAIRCILMALAEAMQHIDEAASTSSLTLSQARDALNRTGLPDDVKQTAALLVAQIDRVIAGNNTLRAELARSREVLQTQQQVIDSLRTEVRVDKMTQFANRAHFDERLDDLLRSNRRADDGFFLLLVDVDNFKAINDNYGHPAGDRILKGVAFKLKNALRESDFVARFGGDEFAIILVKANRHAATGIAWKLCQEIRDSRFLLDGNDIQVTVSIGAAEALPGDTSDTLIKRADGALYDVKESGRNGVRIAE
ncbi:GGDEF domain-containing protein [Geomesophilobacter sediminis]|uniref:diguanylate cyclase n=1 Tax=Geomesophilobacter sediminis TaxID=2798584 RepID=A0A8J7JDM7_9BACT|nr:GGDEF domain-containing protein [Geomesophilobacter sediminis]MBJ6725288.1 GGDEF domain-containing protein [Geomesophilobacter sediminis]